MDNVPALELDCELLDDELELDDELADELEELDTELELDALEVEEVELLLLELDALTTMLKAGNDADALPSLTEITIFAYVPIAAVVGVPFKFPVEVLKNAHAGLLLIRNVNAS